ncbi:MAG: family serine peptidase, partial [Candidatus Thermoplasmatota archaeon]|nr:family serine peptidase [Candidatus Thermoplasmatota archaeon]
MRFTLIVSVLFAAALMLAGPVQPLPPESHVAGTAATSTFSELLDSADAIVIETADAVSLEMVADLVTANGGAVKSSYSSACLMGVSLGGSPESLLDKVMSHPGVLSISPERKAHVLLTPDDPDISSQWGLESILAYDAWDISLGSHDVVVAVLDTGIDWEHQDLAANMWTNDDGYYGYNFVDENWYPMDDNTNGYDDDGDWQENTYTYHGTHVAGVVGAVTDNGEGVAGLAQVRLMAVKVMNDSGEGTDLTVANGVRYAADNDADVIVMSLGVEGTSTALQNAVNYAASRGVVLVAAAGNSGTSTLTYPAAFPNVIGVGAIDDTDRRASFSNFGTGLDVMAPGVLIYSTMGGGAYQYLSGTSAAAPHVAGVAAVMLSVNPALTPEDVGQNINETARDLSIPGWDTGTGWGVVNAFEAVAAVAEPTVTFTEYPEYVPLNETYSITWLVSGGDPGTIGETYIEWGFSPGEVAGASASFSGTTWAEFTVADLPSIPTNGTIYLTAYAEVDGVLYSSDVLEIPVTEAQSDNEIIQFLRDFIETIIDFIVNVLGVIPFILLLVV